LKHPNFNIKDVKIEFPDKKKESSEEKKEMS
jgi:hypothetical protein